MFSLKIENLNDNSFDSIDAKDLNDVVGGITVPFPQDFPLPWGPGPTFPPIPVPDIFNWRP